MPGTTGMVILRNVTIRLSCTSFLVFLGILAAGLQMRHAIQYSTEPKTPTVLFLTSHSIYPPSYLCQKTSKNLESIISLSKFLGQGRNA